VPQHCPGPHQALNCTICISQAYEFRQDNQRQLAPTKSIGSPRRKSFFRCAQHCPSPHQALNCTICISQAYEFRLDNQRQSAPAKSILMRYRLTRVVGYHDIKDHSSLSELCCIARTKGPVPRPTLVPMATLSSMGCDRFSAATPPPRVRVWGQ
jgi:hypothetical protein